MSSNHIKTVLNEDRSFDPPAAFCENAYISNIKDYESIWNTSVNDTEGFWGQKASTLLSWYQPFDEVLNWQEPFAKWFEGGKINASYNCVDRHVENGLGEKTAIIWEGEPGDQRVLTYTDLKNQVSKLANGLKKLGVNKGDRVTIYMPMIPELVISVLACARIGAVHSVIFGGFSSDAIAERNNDAEAKIVITADGGYRKKEKFALKDRVDEALERSTTIEKVLVFQRTKQDVTMTPKRDVWWHDICDELSDECEPEKLDSEHPLFLLYTSGSTGKPKGILHTTAGYLLGATLSSKYVFDLKEDDIYWCTADVGWITGHSYLIYGPLSNASTIFMYEGAPMCPAPDRFWQMIERHKVSILYTAPTAIRAFMKEGDEWLKNHDLSSLRLLGTVGEPINPEAWMWYREKIGLNNCPIVDTWWQTETGSIMITPLPGATTTIPGTATKPFFGIDARVVDENGKEVEPDQGGYLVIAKPWPSMLRTINNDPDRYVETYWSKFKGMYFTGDGARRDKDGNIWILGRIDDVLNVSGHRLSTMEIESALVSHESVAEAAVVGAPHDLKGECIICFVTLDASVAQTAELEKELSAHVTKEIGALARPEKIIFSASLPKTRSGKIMRRLLRNIAAGKEESGDMSTLEDGSVLENLRV